MLKTNYKGSSVTKNMVADQISLRFGESEVANYNPYKNCKTFQQWKKDGYRVKRGEKALKSITYVEAEDDENGAVKKKYRKNINLFYILQVERITA